MPSLPELNLRPCSRDPPVAWAGRDELVRELTFSRRSSDSSQGMYGGYTGMEYAGMRRGEGEGEEGTEEDMLEMRSTGRERVQETRGVNGNRMVYRRSRSDLATRGDEGEVDIDPILFVSRRYLNTCAEVLTRFYTSHPEHR